MYSKCRLNDSYWGNSYGTYYKYKTFSWKSMADFFGTTTSVGGNKNLVNGVGI